MQDLRRKILPFFPAAGKDLDFTYPKETLAVQIALANFPSNILETDPSAFPADISAFSHHLSPRGLEAKARNPAEGGAFSPW